jgi:hypothetical protein
MNGLCLRTQEGISNAVIICPIETRSGRRCTSSPPKHSCVFGGASSGCSPLPAEVRHAEARAALVELVDEVDHFPDLSQGNASTKEMSAMDYHKGSYALNRNTAIGHPSLRRALRAAAQ